MFKLILTISIAFICLSTTWMMFYSIQKMDLSNSHYLFAFLSNGGNRGRIVDMFLCFVPNFIAGFVIARYIGADNVIRFWMIVLFVMVLAILNSRAIQIAIAKANWPPPLNRPLQELLNTAVLVTIQYLAGCLMGYGAWLNRKSDVANSV